MESNRVNEYDDKNLIPFHFILSHLCLNPPLTNLPILAMLATLFHHLRSSYDVEKRQWQRDRYKHSLVGKKVEKATSPQCISYICTCTYKDIHGASQRDLYLSITSTDPQRPTHSLTLITHSTTTTNPTNSSSS